MNCICFHKVCHLSPENSSLKNLVTSSSSGIFTVWHFPLQYSYHGLDSSSSTVFMTKTGINVCSCHYIVQITSSIFNSGVSFPVLWASVVAEPISHWPINLLCLQNPNQALMSSESSLKALISNSWIILNRSHHETIFHLSLQQSSWQNLATFLAALCIRKSEVFLI